jgi:hypothetical protein
MKFVLAKLIVAERTNVKETVPHEAPLLVNDKTTVRADPDAPLAVNEKFCDSEAPGRMVP